VPELVFIFPSYKVSFSNLFPGFSTADRYISLIRRTLIFSFNLVVFLLWLASYAVMTRNPWAYAIPGYLFPFIYFFNIPKLDAHLAAKYPEEIRECRQQTKRLIPFVFQQSENSYAAWSKQRT
jgi:hypothetical protein